MLDQHDILLTGSVVQYCPALLKHGVWSPQERLVDYLCAIRLWLDHPNVRSVVYCDSGEFSIPETFFPGKRFESLSVNLIDLCVEKGRGAAECESIRYALEKSRLLGDRFFKCTGRLFVGNFDRIVPAVRSNGRFLYLNKCDRLKGADSRFYGINRKYFLADVLPLVSKMHDYSGEIVEKVFYEHVHRYCLFPLAFIVGRSGYSGAQYNEYFSSSLIEESKLLVAKIMPSPSK